MEHIIYLNDYMGQFAEMLGCREEDLVILIDPGQTNVWLANRFYRRHKTNNFKDKKIPLHPGIARYTAPLGKIFPMRYGWDMHGITKYEADGTPYLIAICLDPSVYNHTLEFMIYKRGTLRAIIKYHKAKEKEFVQGNIQKPILPEGLMERVLNNSIEFLNHRRQLKKRGVRAARGLLFTGPPGNGKTMLCNYIKSLCGLSGKSYDTISAPALEKAFAQDDLDHTVNRADVLFFDDIDAAYLSRKGDGKMSCALLSALDGINESRNAVVRIFTTNEEITGLDEAFTRPGRIDEIIHFGQPTEDLRRQMIKAWDADIVEAIDVEGLLAETDKCSFAMLEGIKNNLVLHQLKTGEWDLAHVLEECPSNADHVQKGLIGFNRDDGPGVCGYERPLESECDHDEDYGTRRARL